MSSSSGHLSTLVLVGCASAASALQTPLLLRQVAIAVREPLTTLRWQLDLARSDGEWPHSGKTALRLGVDVEVRENDKGRGLYAMRSIEKESLVVRYTGVIKSGVNWYESDETGYYAMEMANGDIIDGENERRSNFGRFINHSVRRANCQACDAWPSGTQMAAVYLETTRTIKAGDELLFDYGPTYWDEQKMPRWKRIAIDYL